MAILRLRCELARHPARLFSAFYGVFVSEIDLYRARTRCLHRRTAPEIWRGPGLPAKRLPTQAVRGSLGASSSLGIFAIPPLWLTLEFHPLRRFAPPPLAHKGRLLVRCPWLPLTRGPLVRRNKSLPLTREVAKPKVLTEGETVGQGLCPCRGILIPPTHPFLV